MDRRKGPDFWTLALRYLAVLGWLLLLVAIVISYYAAPETEYGIVRYYHMEVRTLWRHPLTGYLYALLWFDALLSLACLIINHFRSHRAGDSHYFNLVLLMMVSLAWVLYINMDKAFS